jgi:hypothetical protein
VRSLGQLAPAGQALFQFYAKFVPTATGTPSSFNSNAVLAAALLAAIDPSASITIRHVPSQLLTLMI